MTSTQPAAQAIAEIERAEKHYRTAIIAAAFAELGLLAGLLLLVDLHNRTQALLFCGFVGSYTVVVLAVAALGTHVSRMGQRILRAISATQPG